MTTYVTGDIHGAHDIWHLDEHGWSLGQTLGSDDRLVILGDFGLVWNDPPSGSDTFWLQWLEAQPWGETCFVDGNHENFDVLDRMPVSEWHDGHVQRLPKHPSIIHLMRGETYKVDGETWWVFGGAKSQDAGMRMPHVSWWPQEIPNDAEMEHGLETLEAIDHAPDYVMTHECSYHVMKRALLWNDKRMGGKEPPHDDVSDYLALVDNRLDWDRVKRWYSGHHHDEDLLDPDGKHVLLYRQVVKLGEVPEVRDELKWD